MVDYMLWPWFERLPLLKEMVNFEFDTKKYPKLAGWIERMKQLPAVKEAGNSTENYVKYFKALFSGNPVYDF